MFERCPVHFFLENQLLPTNKTHRKGYYIVPLRLALFPNQQPYLANHSIMSARIDLSSRANLCSLGGIDRTKPAILEPYMSRAEWDRFCNDIDRAVQPVHFWNYLSLGSFYITFLTFCVCIFIQIISIATTDRLESGPPSLMLFIIPLSSAVVATIGICLFSWKALEASLAIEHVCRATSNRKPQMSFHVRYERYFHRSFLSNHHGHSGLSVTQYIEVCINQNAAQDSLETALYPLSDRRRAIEGTAANRLENLERAKRHMTQKEYDEKRAEILSSL